MSRSFTPPDTLSKDEIRTVANVRRDIWTSAFYGMAFGSLSGLGLHTVIKKYHRASSSSLNRNTALFSFLAGGAFGSFLMATTTGKNQVHLLHDIFQVGSTKTKEEYQESLLRAQQRSSDLRNLEQDRLVRRASIEEDQQEEEDGAPQQQHIVDVEQERSLRHKNRVLRRKTIQETIVSGHGLSDSHGGRWAQDERKR